MTDIPAAFAAETPAKASSNTKQFSGFAPKRCATNKKISGAGLPFLSSGSSPRTIC